MTVNYLLAVSIMVAFSSNATTDTAASIYQQSASHNKIKLRVKVVAKKTFKVNNLKPLLPITRPSIRAKAFQQQQFVKSSLVTSKVKHNKNTKQ